MFELNRLYNLDCMEAMKQIPDKFFSLAVCDPPYGIGQDGQHLSLKKNPSVGSKRNVWRKFHERRGWDKAAPPKEYFLELERISENQIIFGGNYFVPFLDKATKGWIVWDKGQHGLSMSDCELIYTSFNRPTRVVVISRNALQQEPGRTTIHPTQKPIKLLKWILYHYAEQGNTVIDTHAGSASCLIACHELRLDFLGFEIDEGYFEAANKRLKEAQAQLTLLDIDGGGGTF